MTLNANHFPGVTLAAFFCTAILSNPAAAQAPTHNDVAYAEVTNDDGTTATLRMDIWEANADVERAPLLIWIHGGAWLAGSYNDQPPGLQPLLDAGYAVASVQYRLSGAAIFPAQIHDVKGATRFLRAHADKYRLDATRCAAFGGSAGGHLAALLATSGDVDALEGTTGDNLDFSSSVQAGIDYFGPTDFWSVEADVTTPPGCVINHDAHNSPESKLIGFDAPGQGIVVLRTNRQNSAAPFPEKAQLVNLANPITHIDADDPPIFIAHGDADNVVPVKQSARLAGALQAAGIAHEYQVVKKGGHGFGPQETSVNEKALAFLNAKLKPAAEDVNR